MNKFLPTAVAVAALTTIGAANAADLPVKAAPMAPIAAPSYGWTGFYLNAGGGYGLWGADTTTVNPITRACILRVTPAPSGKRWVVTAGGGMEAMFAPGWFWRSEYRYADYGTVNLSDTAPGGPVVVVPGVGAFANPQSTITFHPIVQTIRSEIVYKFNWGPVVAKY